MLVESSLPLCQRQVDLFGAGGVGGAPFHGFVHYAAHQLEKLRRDEQASDRQLQKFLGYVQQYRFNR